MNKTYQDNHGFTLIEIMVVVLIIGILVGAVAINFVDTPNEARVIQTQSDMVTLESALDLYQMHNGRYPTTDQGLTALVTAPSEAKKWKEGGYLRRGKVPKDPWGNDYVYNSPGSHGRFDLTCLGADGVSGGESFDADINNWEIE